MFNKKVLSRSLHILFSGSLAVGFGAIASPAIAQQSESADKVQRVEITGSNIRRTDKETPSPVQIITLQEMKASGYTDVSSVLRNITANGAGTLTQAAPASFAGGASGIALRGLTVGATLVLIDGHRMAPYALSDDGQRSFVDISNIPFDAIEKIEILKDGASSVYGSDAIAGVVNVILKKKFVGAEINGEIGTTSKRDGTTAHVSGIYGWGDLEKDGHNAYFSAEYHKQNKILVSDRNGAFTNTDWSAQGGRNLTQGFVQVPGYQPRSITGYFIDPNSGDISGYLPGCDAASQLAGKCTYRNPVELQPQSENINLITSYVQKLSGDWQLNLKGSVFNSKSDQVNNYPNTLMNNGNGGQTQIAFGPGQLPVVNGPFLFTVPATYPGNTTGSPQWLQYNFANLGPQRTDIESQTLRFVGELTGSIANWDVTASAGYTKNTVKQNIYGALQLANLQAALNDPVNPYLVGLAAGGNSAARNNFIAPPAYSKATDILEFVSVRGARELMTLAGGPLSIGLGAEFTHRELNAPAPATALDGSQLVNNAFAMGNQNVSAGYIELVAPVLTNLELDAAVRYDKNSGGSNATTPKLGFKYSPIKQFTVRGTYAQGFRAPNPAEAGNAGQSFLANTYVDPILCANQGADQTKVPGNYPAQCAVALTGVQLPGKNLQPEKSKSYTLGLIIEPSKDLSLTTDFYKIRINNQIISTQSDPTYDPAPYIVRGAPIPQPYVLPDGSIGTRTPSVGNALYAPYPYENAQYTEVQGVDLNAHWTLDLKSSGKFVTDLTWSHTFKYEQGTAGGTPVRLEGTHGPSGVSGDTGNPKDRVQLVMAWDNGPVNVTGTVNWISSYGVTDPTSPQALTCEAAIHGGSGAFRGAVPQQYCNVDSFTTFDLYASYQYSKNWKFHASIQNLFDKQPPLDFQTYGGASSTFYNPALHQSGAVGRFLNIGASYKF